MSGIGYGVFITFLLASTAPAAAQRDSLDLTTALQLARERSPVLAAALADDDAAQAAVAAARSARLPQLSAEGLYLRYEDAPSIQLGSAGSYTPFAENGYLAGIRAQQTLYSSGRITASIRGARANERAAAFARQQAEVDLTAAVARAYDDALLARAMEEVAEQSAAVLRRSVEVAAAHYAEGTAARLDLLRAETRLSSAETAARAARDESIAGRERLAALIGLDPHDALPVAGQLELDPVDAHIVRDADPPLLPGSSLPAAEARQATAEAARARASAARAAQKPAVNVFLAAITSRPELVSGERQWGWELLGGVSITVPLYDGGRSAGLAAMADAKAARAMAEAAEVQLAAAAAVGAQHRALVRIGEDVATARKNVGRAERALAIAEERYTDGIGPQLELLEAEADLTRARGELWQAIHAHRVAAVELRRALGVPADARLPASRED